MASEAGKTNILTETQCDVPAATDRQSESADFDDDFHSVN